MQHQNYLAAVNNVLRTTPATVKHPFGRRESLPGGIPHRFVSPPVAGPQCCTVTLQIRDEDLKPVLGLADRFAMSAGSHYARVYRDLKLVRVEFTLPPHQWCDVPLHKLPNHRSQPTIGQKALGPVCRLSWDISPHKAVFGGTQTGKTTCLADIIISLVKMHQPADLRLLILNPKNAPELAKFARLAHLAAPIAVANDDCANLLRYALAEMELRKTNAALTQTRQVIIIDEVADLCLSDDSIGITITRLVQMAGGLRQNLIAASQAANPSVFGKKGSLSQANFGGRLVFQLPQQYAWLASGGVTGLHTESLGAGDKKGDALAISNGHVVRFRAALPAESDYETLPRAAGEPESPPPDRLAGDVLLTELAWQQDDLADRLAYAAEVKPSATALIQQFGGSAARAAWVRDLLTKFNQRREYWQSATGVNL
jgi:hypothetical protein